MKKRTLSVLLAASMAASMLAGCGSSNGTAETTKAAETTAAADVAETTAAEAGAENKEVSGDQMIAMITDSGDITDESFNQITWETCVAYGDKSTVSSIRVLSSRQRTQTRRESTPSTLASRRRRNRSRYAGLSVRTGNR